MSESRLWQEVKEVFPGKIQRFEPGMPAGMGDCFWAYRGAAGWLELKYNVTEVRPQQAIFLRQWANAGVRAHVLVKLNFDVWGNRAGYYLFEAHAIGIDRKLHVRDAIWASNNLTSTGLIQPLARKPFAAYQLPPLGTLRAVSSEHST